MEYIKKYRKNIFIGFFLVAALIIFYGSQKDLNDIIDALKMIRLETFLFAALGMIFFYAFDAIGLYVFLKHYIEKQTFKNTVYIALSAHFFNGITPFSSGGQPFQVYYFNKKGIKPSDSTSALLMNFIVYQITITMICSIALLVKGSFIAEHVDNFSKLIILGFSVNLGVLILLIAMAKSDFLNHLLIDIILNTLAKLPFLRFIQKKEKALRKFVGDYQQNIDELQRNPMIFLFAFLLNIGKMLLFYGIPVIIFYGMGNPVTFDQTITLLAIGSFVWTITAFVPTPGASGGAEITFGLLYLSLFPEPMVVAALLIWRLFTYYISLLVGFGAALRLEKE